MFECVRNFDLVCVYLSQQVASKEEEGQRREEVPLVWWMTVFESVSYALVDLGASVCVA